MAGSGIRHIGIITKYNYQSLMDHLGSCQEWDLQLNTHGVVFVPPYATGHTGIYRGKLEALHTALPVRESGNQDYVVLAESNIPVRHSTSPRCSTPHVESGADVIASCQGRHRQRQGHPALLLFTTKEPRHRHGRGLHRPAGDWWAWACSS